MSGFIGGNSSGGGGGGGSQNLAQVLIIGNSAGGKAITNLLDPTGNQEAATKKYVDDTVADGGASDLASVLTTGNTTGGTDLEVSTGDELVGQTDLTFNVPTASTYIFKINAANEMVLNATTLDLQNNALTSTGAGTLSGLTLSALGTGIAHLNSSGVFSSSLIVNADVNAAAAIAGTKISPNFGSQNILTSGSGTVASLVVSGLTAGIGHFDGSGNLTSSAIVNADVSASAAIAGTKISPDFGSQAVVTTGTLGAHATTVTTLQVTGLSTGIGHFDGSGNLTSSLLVNADVSGSAAIAGTKVSPDFGSQNIVTTGSGTVNSLTVSSLSTGIGHYNSSGVLTSSLIVNADVNAAAAIAGTKISPDFGSQNIVTTGVASLGTTPATAGGFRLANNLDINFRNAGNSANIRGIGTDGSDNLLIGSTAAANTTLDLATSGVYTFKINGGTEATLNATTLDLQNNAITTTGAGTVNSLTVSSLGTGIGHYNSSGVLSSSLIVNADVNAAAAIAGTKISPDFGSQNIVTTGVESLGTTPATAGILRIANNNDINFRNAGNSANIRGIGTDGSDNLLIGNTSAANTTLDLATSGVYTFKINGGTELTLNATTLDLQNNAITTTGAGTVNSLTVSSLSTGIGHYNSSGVLTSSLIVNADVNAAAAIAGTKISPDFGSQNIVTTGVASLGTTPATAGGLRFANNLDINFRNAANSANVRAIGVDGSNNVLVGNTSAANITFDMATGGLYTFNINGGTELTLNATTLNLQNNAITTTGAGTVNSLTVSSLSTGIGHFDGSGVLTSSTIVNADVNAAAAIAGTKISPDFGSQNVSTTGNFIGGVGTTGLSSTIVSSAILLMLFGDGSDGDLTTSAGTTTLTRDTYYNNLTVNGTAKIACSGFKLYVKGTLDLSAAAADSILRTTVNGTNGNANGTGGAAVAVQQAVGDTFPSMSAASIVGGAGGTAAGTSGGGANNNTTLLGGVGGAGSTGGTGNGGANAGGTTGGAGSQGVTGLRFNDVLSVWGGISQTQTGNATLSSFVPSTAGRAGGGGGGDGTAGGGGGSGAAGGGALFLSAFILKTDGTTAAGVISAKGGVGGTGGTPAAGNRGGGGAGGGGGGGVIFVVCGSRSGATVTNGLDASGGTGGVGGSATGTGVGADGGTGGGAGKVFLFVLSTTTSTSSTTGTAGSAGNAHSGTTGGTGGAGGAGTLNL